MPKKAGTVSMLPSSLMGRPAWQGHRVKLKAVCARAEFVGVDEGYDTVLFALMLFGWFI